MPDRHASPDCNRHNRLVQHFGGRAFNFLVELDCGSERVRSQKETDSIDRKIRLYEAFQDRCRRRFRVLSPKTWACWPAPLPSSSASGT